LPKASNSVFIPALSASLSNDTLRHFKPCATVAFVFTTRSAFVFASVIILLIVSGFSSSEVYGDFDGVMSESIMDKIEIKQMNDYAISKWTNEMQIRNSRILSNTESVIVRLFNTYGPGEIYHPYRSVNCKFCYHALNNLPITVYTGHYRSSTYIDDAISAIANISSNFIDGRVYNIGSNEFHDIETLASIIWDYTKANPSLITYKSSEVLTTKTKISDISLSVSELGYAPSVDLVQGVHNTIDWMREYLSVHN
jgi:dTDP-glucose 4,6-dehydratase